MKAKMTTNEERDKNATLKCSFYNDTLCPGISCKEEEECKVGEFTSNSPNLCYVLWQNNSDNLVVKLKGCWVGPLSTCAEVDRCVEHRRNPPQQLNFCCCSGDLCNRDMFHIPDPQIPSTGTTPTTTIPPRPNYEISIVVLTLLPLMLLTLLLIFAYWFYRYRKLAHFNELPTKEEGFSACEFQKRFVPFKPIQLIEIKAAGRFGAVWKARIGVDSNKDAEQFVAAKIFPRQDKSSWATEVEVYQLPKMRHENVLTYLGAEERDNMLPYNIEYWLITEYHENGSLSDYLKSHLVTYNQLLKIGEGIAKGLTFLHEEISANKPAVAHRDFKSKNVLLKNDLTPCIGDFGLALIFYPGRSLCDTLGQVGTRRYMAPEVLEGAINFSRDGLLRIDMYACGLVLWEILSRCSLQDGPIGNYMLPFEEEIGQHPTLEDIQETVCQQKKRPEIKQSWKESPNLRWFCETVEECWDQDAEARLSASCVDERISCHRSYYCS